MQTAYLYFGAMVVLMLPLVIVHLICWQVVKRFPNVMPDQKQRDRYIWAELAMASACLAMIWYMLKLLPWMVSICASDPLTGLTVHVPWIVATGCVLLAKTRHLWRLMAQVQAL